MLELPRKAPIGMTPNLLSVNPYRAMQVNLANRHRQVLTAALWPSAKRIQAAATLPAMTMQKAVMDNLRPSFRNVAAQVSFPLVRTPAFSGFAQSMAPTFASANRIIVASHMRKANLLTAALERQDRWLAHSLLETFRNSLQPCLSTLNDQSTFVAQLMRNKVAGDLDPALLTSLRGTVDVHGLASLHVGKIADHALDEAVSDPPGSLSPYSAPLNERSLAQVRVMLTVILTLLAVRMYEDLPPEARAIVAEWAGFLGLGAAGAIWKATGLLQPLADDDYWIDRCERRALER